MGFLFSAQAVEIIAAIVGGIATALGGAAASGLFEKVLKPYLKRSISQEILEMKDQHIAAPLQIESKKPRFETASRQVAVRLDDARYAMVKQQRSARWSRWSANSLTFGQYVIGGVMTLSFVQKTLSPNVIGIFGTLVVVSSLLKQHYHPEATAQIALQKASQLEALVRQSEDRLVVIETTDIDNDDPSLVLELLERVSAELSRITLPSADVAPPRTSSQKRVK